MTQNYRQEKHEKLSACLAQKGWLLADGATGTNLFRVGLETGYPPELWNFEAPEKISALHNDFIDAGADIILTNSFGGNALRLKLHEAEDRVAELNIAAARLARAAADAAPRDVLVAGSIGPTGELFAPLGALDMAQAEAVFAEQAEALAEGGVDLLQIETMSSLEEVEAAAKAAARVGIGNPAAAAGANAAGVGLASSTGTPASGRFVRPVQGFLQGKGPFSFLGGQDRIA